MNEDNFLNKTTAPVKNKIFWLKNYKKSFQNYLTVSKNVVRGNFPIMLVLKNGEEIIADSIDQIALYALTEHDKKFKYSKTDDLLTIFLDREKIIKIYGISKSIDGIMTFNKLNPYYRLNVKNKTVIDVGGAIGDSAIFFAINEAKKIICVEPYPINFKFAEKNILENNFGEIIDLKLAACAGKSGEIKIDPNTESSMRTSLKEKDSSFSVPLITIENIMDEYNIENIVLKMDCEGCEYESIFDASERILKKIDSVVIEFHDGVKNLKNKLQDTGFHVSDIIYETKKYGYLLAIRKH